MINFFDPTCWQKRPIFLQQQLKDLQGAPQITALKNVNYLQVYLFY